MKKFLTVAVTTALAIAVYAQSPNKMSYQCVVRNSAGALVANHAVSMKISILKGSATTGTVVFSETYIPVPQTNANGLVTVEIGSGTASVGTFSGIDWADGPYFLKTETDPDGGTSYTITGTSQLMSVPYALYAKTAANGFSGAWADLTGRPIFSTVATTGSYNDLLNKPSLFSGRYNDLTDKPVLFDGTWTSLTGKPVLFDGTWTSLTGKPAGFADGIDNVDDADNSVTNEIQALSLSGTVLSLSNGGGSVTLPSSGGGDNWGTQTVVTNTTLTGMGTSASPLAVANTIITPSWSRIQGIPAGFADGTDNIDDADNSITNEIQTINLSGTTLSLSLGGGSVTLPSSGGGDNWGTQVVVTDLSLAGSGTTATPLRIADNGVSTMHILNAAVTANKLATNAVTDDKINAGAVTGVKIAQAGATVGQVLKWNGTTWAPAADATGGTASGWTDDGSIIRLTTTTDSVQMGSVNRLGKFNVGGNIGLNATSSIYFGSEATRISGLTGGDIRLVAEDLSMLTTEDITFGHYGDETWITFENATKRVGIGTLTPTDRLHVVLDETAVGISAVRGVATSAAGSAYGVYGQAAGYRGRAVMGDATGTNSIGVMGVATAENSTGVWGDGANQGVYGKSDLATGRGVFGQVTSATGYSGYFDGGRFYVSGNTGIGTTSPAKKLHVIGSAQVRDTLFASAVRITNSPRVFYKNSSTGWPKNITTMESWGPLDSVSVVAPGPGSVLLNVTGCLNSSHTYNGNTWVYIGISAIRRSSNFEDVLSQTVWLLHENLVGGYYQVPCAVTAVATVASAGTYKYYIVGWFNEWDGDEDDVDFGSGAISALFIPAY
ncbi:MAG: hypothetical protein AB9888_07200 [Bacteroidales bacterium]